MDKKYVPLVSGASLVAQLIKNPPVMQETPAFSKQECWSGLPIPSPGDLPDPGIEPRSPAMQADSLPSEPPGKPICLSVTLKTEHYTE